MKAKLTFKLPEDSHLFRVAQEGERWRRVVQELDEHLRSTIKHGDYPDDQRALLTEIRRRLLDACAEDDLSMGD